MCYYSTSTPSKTTTAWYNSTVKINHLISIYDITIKSRGYELFTKEHIAMHAILPLY